MGPLLKEQLGLKEIFGSITFLPKDDLRAPLEAADFLAYYSFKYAQSVALQRQETPSTKRILNSLQRSKKIFVKHYPRTSLIKFQEGFRAALDGRTTENTI